MNLPDDIKALRSWLVWRYEQHPGEPKPRKVPYYATGARRQGKQGVPEDRAQLVTFDEAQAASADGYSGVGLAMLADNGLVALDFDGCIDAEGRIDPTVERLVVGTYAERSPSGRGVRALMRGALKDRKDRDAGFEVFHGSGFVTITGDLLPDCELLGADVAPLSDAVRAHYAARFGRPAESAEPQDQARMGLSEGRLRDMLSRLDPSCGYEPWLKAGMALHHESGGQPYGLALWDEWSAKSEKYPGREAIDAKWDSFGRARDTVVTAGWLMREAGGPLATADDFDEPVAGAKRFRLHRVVDLRQGSLDSDYHIKHILDHAALAVLYGESTAGKTFVAIDLAAHVALGREWRGHRVRQGRAVYVCTEGAEGFKKRLAAFCSEHGIDDIPELRVVNETPSLLNGDHAELAASVNEWGDVRTIWLDTWSRAIAGGDENSSEVVTKAIARATKLHDATGAMVVLVAHSGKDQSKGVRGHSSLKGSADVQIEVVRDGEGPSTRRAIRLEKVKDGPNEGATFGFALRVVDLGVDQDGDSVTSCVVADGEKPTPGVRKMGANESAALAVVHSLIDLSDGGGVSVTDAKAAVVASEHFSAVDQRHRNSRAQTALQALENKGALLREAGQYRRG